MFLVRVSVIEALIDDKNDDFVGFVFFVVVVNLHGRDDNVWPGSPC